MGATALYYLSRESDLEVTVFDHVRGVKPPRPQQELSVLGFPNAVIKPGKMGRAWGQIYVDLLEHLERNQDKKSTFTSVQESFSRKDENPLLKNSINWLSSAEKNLP